MNLIYDFLSSALPFSWADYKFMVNAFVAVLLIAPLMGVLLGIKNEMISLVAFGVFLALIITRVKNKGNTSSDTVISVFSSTSVAVGLLVLSYGGSFSKYSAYLVGDILSVTGTEILSLFITLIAVIIIWSLIYNKLLVISVNRELAASRGIKTAVYENIFVIVVAVVVMMSIKWVGILLINSLLILPAAAARNISKNSRQYLISSVILSLVCGVSGLLISFYGDTSAGATIVTVSATVFFATYIFRKNK